MRVVEIFEAFLEAAITLAVVCDEKELYLHSISALEIVLELDAPAWRVFVPGTTASALGGAVEVFDCHEAQAPRVLVAAKTGLVTSLDSVRSAGVVAGKTQNVSIRPASATAVTQTRWIYSMPAKLAFEGVEMTVCVLRHPRSVLRNAEVAVVAAVGKGLEGKRAVFLKTCVGVKASCEKTKVLRRA